jgi:hypothetical protein
MSAYTAFAPVLPGVCLMPAARDLTKPPEHGKAADVIVCKRRMVFSAAQIAKETP